MEKNAGLTCAFEESISGENTCIIRNVITRATGLATNIDAENMPSQVRILLMKP